MLRQLDLPTLNHIVMMFKILKNAVHIPVKSPIFTFNFLGTRGHSYKLNQLGSYIQELTPKPFPSSLMLLNFGITSLH